MAFFIDDWEAPNFPDDWYDRISLDPRAFRIAERFVRDQLPHENGSYGTGFPVALDRIATRLDGAYLHAARQLVGMGHGWNIEAVVTGALRKPFTKDPKKEPIAPSICPESRGAMLDLAGSE